MFELDDDGYPTDETLDYIFTWKPNTEHETRQQYFDLFEGIKSVWRYACWGWREQIKPHLYKKSKMVREYHLSTGGWSGNESLIRAMESNLWIHIM